MKRNILVVEDDTATCMLLRQILTNKDVTVDIAKDAIEGWEKAIQKNYDLLIIDLNLPFGENGFELVSRLRTIPQYKNTPVIAITAYIGIFEKEECLKKGFNYYIAKPFDIKFFAKQVNEILNLN